ncbi:hypothetical protein PRUPE_1G394500 [Prunus persica]|uniref:Uncharacterized protein n=1 Tax=Prunus persica TaxID=3760 RepID=A0A251RA92_PRUPE|nr:hypothetical protein PRUPE_1G394500 [Prunus persica]
MAEPPSNAQSPTDNKEMQSTVAHTTCAQMAAPQSIARSHPQATRRMLTTVIHTTRVNGSTQTNCSQSPTARG